MTASRKSQRCSRLVYLFALLAAANLPVAAQNSNNGPGHHTSVEYRYYEVSGLSNDDILRAMLANGPLQNGRRFFGLTESITSLNFKTQERPGGCRLTRLRVSTEVVVTLPKWTDASSAGTDMAGRWRVFEIALQNHEGWHIASAREMTRRIHDALAEIDAPDCLLASNLARKLSGEIQAEVEAENLAYDRMTGHGRTQGASWPPQ